jgi:uncharacterized protein (TIGR03083 family)
LVTTDRLHEIDQGAMYRAARLRLSELIRGIDADTEARQVPATPLWTVHDLVAHVVGVAADGTSGNMAGAPGEAWTAAQVARGKGVPIADLLADWERTGPLMEAFLSSSAGAMAGAAVLDVHTHEADLRHALGLPMQVPDDFLQWGATRMSDGFAEAVAGSGLPPVTVDASTLEWFRGRFGRRTEAEVRAYGWFGPGGERVDPGPYLDQWFVFGRATAPLGETTGEP